MNVKCKCRDPDYRDEPLEFRAAKTGPYSSVVKNRAIRRVCLHCGRLIGYYSVDFRDLEV